MPSDHRDYWTPRMVFINTIATVLGGLTGVAALVVAVVALLYA